jgi:outer membrane protein OmpA-like peptidoglycan-associated protein
MNRFIQLVLILLAAGVTTTLEAQPVPKSLPVTNRTETDITPLSINSLEDDFAATVIRGGEQVIFTSARPGMFGSAGTQRLWLALRTSPGWSAPTTTSEALSRGEHVGSATLTPDGNFMIFAATDWEDAAQKGSGRTDLYSAELVRGEWSNIRNLGPIVNSSGWDSQPSISPDGRTLYFASDRPGGEGGTDIYVTRLSAAGWSAPMNVGSSLNTPFDDMAPSIAPDMKALFFASNGYGGVGGFDLFIARGGNALGQNWGSIENVGTPINSVSDEFFFISLPNSKNSYFSSNRAGNFDIFLASPNPYPAEALVTVAGKVLDATTKRPIAADISVTDLATGEVVANYRTDDRSGDYYVVLAKGRRYSITAESPDFIFYSDEYSVPATEKGRNVEKDIELFRTTGGTTRLLVFFDFGKSTLQNESKPDLRRAVEFLKKNPNLSAEVAGFTDSVGSNVANQKLSTDRANSVRQFLLDNGVPASRLVARGYGEEQPQGDNGTEEGRARNRRVEMRVVAGPPPEPQSTPRR